MANLNLKFEEQGWRLLLRTFGWIFGVLCFLFGLGELLGGNFIAAIPILVIAGLLLPLVRDWTYKKTGRRLPLWARTLSIIGLMMIVRAFVPTEDQAPREAREQERVERTVEERAQEVVDDERAGRPDPTIAQEVTPSGYMVSPSGTRCYYTQTILNELLIESLYEGNRIGGRGRIEFDDQDCMNTTTSADSLGTVLVTVFNHVWALYANQVGEGDPEDAMYVGLPGTTDDLCLQSASNNLGVSLNFIKTGGGRGLFAVNHALALDGCPNTVDPDGVGRELAKTLMRWFP